MEPDPLEHDHLARFDTLRHDSLKLLDDARSLVDEMRRALDRCKRHRPAVELSEPPLGGAAAPPSVKSHRGGRVAKKNRRRTWRRPR